MIHINHIIEHVLQYIGFGFSFFILYLSIVMHQQVPIILLYEDSCMNINVCCNVSVQNNLCFQ